MHICFVGSNYNGSFVLGNIHRLFGIIIKTNIVWEELLQLLEAVAVVLKDYTHFQHRTSTDRVHF